MSTSSHKIVTNPPPAVEFHTVFDSELSNIEESSNQVTLSQSTSFSCGTACLTVVLSLLVCEQGSSEVRAWLTATAVFLGVVFVVTGCKAWRQRRRTSKAIEEIRNRRPDPNVT